MKHYLQDMKPDEIPADTYHVARWHSNGKLWISQTSYFPSREAAQESVDTYNDTPDPASLRSSPYFVWNANEPIEVEKPERL